jgi:hypothetical protein
MPESRNTWEASDMLYLYLRHQCQSCTHGRGVMEVVARITSSLTVYIRPTLHALFLRCAKRPVRALASGSKHKAVPHMMNTF